jgi:hypothetical protein
MSSLEDKLEFLKEIDVSKLLPEAANTVLSLGAGGLSIQPLKPKQFKLELGGSTITLNEDGTVEINAYKGIKFKTDGNVEFDAKNVKMNASHDIEFGSANNISQQAPTIHLNPENDASGYKKG